MRYDKSPEEMTKERIETVLGMIAASSKFIKKGKAARDVDREYLNSGSEGYNTDNKGGSEKTEKDMSEESGKAETDNRKGKGRETYEDEITEFEDPIGNVINMGDFGIPKTSGSEKGSEKDSEEEFRESEEESQELESEEVEDYSESELEEELVIVNPPVNMALNIVPVDSFDGENVDPEAWLQKFVRAAAVNNWVDNARVGFAAAHLNGSAAEWYEKDQKL